jgi:predicted nucleic acid-binding protein
MSDLLIDSDVFIDHLNGSSQFHLARHEPAYSVITRCELFAGRTPPPAVIRELLEPFEELGLDRPIAERAGTLRQQGLKIADAVIAATALRHRLTLVTRNGRDFERVRGLKLRSPD